MDCTLIFYLNCGTGDKASVDNSLDKELTSVQENGLILLDLRT
jgi:hypothetical protein